MVDPNWTPISGDFPYPPANGTAMSAFMAGTELDLRWDDPATLNTGPSYPTTRASLTFTVIGAPLVDNQATATVTVLIAPIAAGAELVIGGVLLTCVAGAPGLDEFDGSSGIPATIAASIVDAVNNGTVAAIGVADAVLSGVTVQLTAVPLGVLGNDLALTTSSPSLELSGFSGGTDPDYLWVGNQALMASATRTAGGMDFRVGPTEFDTAVSIAAAINDRGNTLSFAYARASETPASVTVYAAQDGILGNGIAVIPDSAAFSVPSVGETENGTGVPCPGKSNSEWTILGVNVYRSDTGERGPYFRLNKIPLGTLFYRDRTDVVSVTNEIVNWDGSWIYRGDAPNDILWRFRTRFRPVVKTGFGNAVPANAGADVEVYIDGVRASISQVFGTTGEIDLSLAPTWDPSIENWSRPPEPTATSVVTVSYSYGRGNVLKQGPDMRPKIFYRLTTVAVDPTGSSPSGLVETPLEYSPPISAHASERIDYIWTEAIRRNRFILEQGGERVKLFLRRFSGVPCDCGWDARLLEYLAQPISNCESCFGTGFRGGYEGPTDIIIAPDDSERRVMQTPNGRKLENSYEVWTSQSPIVSQRDFIVKQNGERFSIGPVTRTQIRGVTLQQRFQIGYLAETDIRYGVPMTGLEQLAWPEVRYTRPEDAPCGDAPPYPIGYDAGGVPMGTENPNVPDGREIRGRTPVFANLTYGGRGRG